MISHYLVTGSARSYIYLNEHSPTRFLDHTQLETRSLLTALLFPRRLQVVLPHGLRLISDAGLLQSGYEAFDVSRSEDNPPFAPEVQHDSICGVGAVYLNKLRLNIGRLPDVHL